MAGELGERLREVFWWSRTRHAKMGHPSHEAESREAALSEGFLSPNYSITQSPISLNSLLIPCFCAWGSQKVRYPCEFLRKRKKIPCFFPVIRELVLLVRQGRSQTDIDSEACDLKIR